MSKDTNIEIIMGDITEMDVDAVVNAANTDLRLGSGVAGAIRAKGGPGIQRLCDEHGPVELGSAAITEAGGLKARFVIHAAGMRPGGRVTAESLRGCVNESLRLAGEAGLETIAFPAIGTGVGGFPVHDCAVIMTDVVSEYMLGSGISLKKVYFVLFDDETYGVFNEVLRGVRGMADR